MVRDPVELFISKFYYKRNGFQSKHNEEWELAMNDVDRNKSIEECIHNKGSQVHQLVDQCFKKIIFFRT